MVNICCSAHEKYDKLCKKCKYEYAVYKQQSEGNTEIPDTLTPTPVEEEKIGRGVFLKTFSCSDPETLDNAVNEFSENHKVMAWTCKALLSQHAEGNKVFWISFVTFEQ